MERHSYIPNFRYTRSFVPLYDDSVCECDCFSVVCLLGRRRNWRRRWRFRPIRKYPIALKHFAHFENSLFFPATCFFHLPHFQCPFSLFWIVCVVLQSVSVHCTWIYSAGSIYIFFFTCTSGSLLIHTKMRDFDSPWQFMDANIAHQIWKLWNQSKHTIAEIKYS